MEPREGYMNFVHICMLVVYDCSVLKCKLDGEGAERKKSQVKQVCGTDVVRDELGKSGFSSMDQLYYSLWDENPVTLMLTLLGILFSAQFVQNAF